MLEKKARAETEARLSAEKHLAELQAQKLEEAANAARSLTNRWLTLWHCVNHAVVGCWVEVNSAVVTDAVYEIHVIYENTERPRK